MLENRPCVQILCVRPLILTQGNRPNITYQSLLDLCVLVVKEGHPLAQQSNLHKGSFNNCSLICKKYGHNFVVQLECTLYIIFHITFDLGLFSVNFTILKFIGVWHYHTMFAFNLYMGLVFLCKALLKMMALVFP